VDNIDCFRGVKKEERKRFCDLLRQKHQLALRNEINRQLKHTCYLQCVSGEKELRKIR